MSTLQESDRVLIRDSVDKFIGDNYVFDRHKVGTDAHKFGRHWSDFAELGWLSLPYGEEAGGLGGGIDDVQVLTRAFGRGLIAEPYIEAAVLAGKCIEFCASAQTRDELIGQIVSGELVVVLAHGERIADADFRDVGCAAEARLDGFCIAGIKRVVWQAGAAQKLLVTAVLDGEPALFLVDRDCANLTFDEYTTIDSRFASDIHLNDVLVAKDALIAHGDIAGKGVKDAVLYTFAAFAGELQGIADVLVKQTAAYLNTREQFGTKIGNFQALQHMLANMAISAEEITSLAWLMPDIWAMEREVERERILRGAKARLCIAARKLGELAVQLHGGTGVTDELVVSHYLRRIIAIDAFYGDAQRQLLWLSNNVESATQE